MVVDQVLDLKNLAAHVHGDALGEITEAIAVATFDTSRSWTVSGWPSFHAVGEIFPRPGHPRSGCPPSLPSVPTPGPRE